MEKNRERWMELAEMAANEQDPSKLSDLMREINRLLDEKQERLNRNKFHRSLRNKVYLRLEMF
jgi:hypothetical protein